MVESVSSTFNDVVRVEKVKLAMYLILFMQRVIGEKIIHNARFNRKTSALFISLVHHLSHPLCPL